MDSFEHPETLRFGLLAAALALVEPQLDLLQQAEADIAGYLRRGARGRSSADIA